MILSSHYVIRDILHTFERGDAEEIKKVCDKYCARYRYDKELLEICGVIREKGIGSSKDEGYIKNLLEELLSSRSVESSGGTTLWYSDRRKLK